MAHNIHKFIKQLLSSNEANLDLYHDPAFCKEMKLYALDKIKYLLLDILRAHLPHEHVGSNDPFFLSSSINTVDQEGLNLTDYCILAGLDDMGCIYAKLGGINSINLNQIQQTLSNNSSSELGNSEMINNIVETKLKVEKAISEYKNNPLGEKPMIYGSSNPTLWQKIKHVVINFPYSHHKFSIFILLFGLSCLIAAPFTGGLSTILLLTLGFPSMLAGIGNLQSAVGALNNYQQVEENSRVTHEVEMIRIMHKEVCHQIKMLSKDVHHTSSISMHVNSKNTQHNYIKSNTLMYSEMTSKKPKNLLTKNRKAKIKPSAD